MSVVLKMLPVAIALSAATPGRRVQDDYVIGTKMKDLPVLEGALDSANIKRRLLQGAVFAETRDENILFGFIKGQDETFDAHFAHDIDPDKASAMVGLVTDHYNSIVQQHVLRRVTEEASTQGFRFQSQSTQEDNSIVIVLEVNE